MPNCVDACITDFGAKFDGTTDDTVAWQSAVNAVWEQGLGKLECPAGTSKTSQSIYLNSRLIVEGKGKEVTKIVNSSSDVFVIGLPSFTGTVPAGEESAVVLPSVQNVSFRDLTVESQTGGGHSFVLEALAIFCSWRHLWLKQFNPSKQIFRRVTASSLAAGFFDCVWEHLYLLHSPNATVPAFEISAPGQQFNANTLRNLRCENSWDAPFFRFTCNAPARNNGCVMSQINFEKCLGGMVHWYTAGSWTCENLVQYDITAPTRGHGILLAKAPLGAYSRHMTFIGCDRRSGSLGTGFMDIKVEPFQAKHIVLINCGENTYAKYTVDASDEPLTWLGFVNPEETDPTLGPKLLNKRLAVRIGDGEVRAATIEQDTAPI